MNMVLAIVCFGDASSHGGFVISASDTHTIGGIGVARVGDQVSCPKRDHA